MIGSRSAVVSLGLSCQTARQLQLQAPLISELLDEPVEPSSMLFNWTLTDPRDLGGFLARPSTSTHFSWEDGPVRFSDGRIWLWHDPRCGPDAKSTDLAGAAEKQKYLLRKLTELRRIKRRIFVLANAQSVIAMMDQPEWLDVTITPERVAAIQRGLDTMFPKGSNRLLLGLAPDRTSGMKAGSYFPLTDNGMNDWQGDPDAWADFLRHGLEDRRPLRRLLRRARSLRLLEKVAKSVGEQSPSSGL